jgi:hypothetical protein
MADTPRRPWQYALGLLTCAALGWFAFIQGGPVPLLAAADLGFHELGHLLFAWAPDRLAALMGSGTQILVPLGLATYFLLARRDRLAGALMLAWAATTAQNVSVYIADAPFEALDLIGGRHDWAFLLGPEGWNVLSLSAVIARTVWLAGILLLAAAAGVCAWGVVAPAVATRRAAAEAERLSRLPVREPLTPERIARAAPGRPEPPT